MRIAIYTHSIAPSIDGVCRRFTSILFELVRQGHEILLFTIEATPEDIPSNIQWVHLYHVVFPVYPGKKIAFPTIGNLTSIYYHLAKFKPEIVHCTSDALSSSFAVSCLLLNIPIVGSFHTDLVDLLSAHGATYLQLLCVTTKEYIDSLLFDSCATTSLSFSKKLDQSGIHCQHVIKTAVNNKVFRPHRRNELLRKQLMFQNISSMNYNGYDKHNDNDTTDIDNNTTHSKCITINPIKNNTTNNTNITNEIMTNNNTTMINNTNDENFLCVYVGRLSKEKRIDILVEAIRDIPNTYLAIIGDGPSSSTYAALHSPINRIYCQPRFQTHDELAQVYASSDVHVSASEFETLGNTVLESFACGIPVIVPRTQGFCDTVNDTINGFLFTPRDVEDCKSYILKLKNNSFLKKQMGQNGLLAVEKCGIEDVAQDILLWYKIGLNRFIDRRINKIFLFRNICIFFFCIPLTLLFCGLYNAITIFFNRIGHIFVGDEKLDGSNSSNINKMNKEVYINKMKVNNNNNNSNNSNSSNINNSNKA